MFVRKGRKRGAILNGKVEPVVLDRNLNLSQVNLVAPCLVEEDFLLFDVDTYLQDYPDVKDAYTKEKYALGQGKREIINKDLVYNHFLRFGRHEGRIAYGIKENGEKVRFTNFYHEDYIKVCEDAYNKGVNNEINGTLHYKKNEVKPKRIIVNEGANVFSDAFRNNEFIKMLKREWANFDAWKYKKAHGKNGSAKELFIDYISNHFEPLMAPIKEAERKLALQKEAERKEAERKLALQKEADNFDWNYYLNNNSDLRKAGLIKEDDLWVHWVKYGKNEGRICAPPSYKSIDVNINEYNYLFECVNTDNKSILVNPMYTHSYMLKMQFEWHKMSQSQYTSIFKGKTTINNDKKSILVFDMMWMDGGAYIYLQNLIHKYSCKYNFIIIRESFNEKYINISLNDEYLLETNFTLEQLNNYINNINYEFIFINSLATQSLEYKQFVFSLNGYKIGITHDFSIIYDIPQPTDLSVLKKIYSEFDYNLIISQHHVTSDNMKLTNTIYSEMPDYYNKDRKIDTINETINIAVIGAISKLKGIFFYEKLMNYIKHNNLQHKYKLHFFGNTWPVLQEYGKRYSDINTLNNMLISYKPNIILEASIWPETWSYTLTLSKTIDLPILYLKKKFNNVVSTRLSGYKGYEFTNIETCLDLINKHSQNYFYTVKNELIFPPFYESLFSGNYIENIIVITSKIVVSDELYTYVKTRSIYTREERLQQTIDTINSIRSYFSNKYYRILLIDNSKFSDDEYNLLNKNVDIFLTRDKYENIDYHTDNIIIKGIGESAQQAQVNNYLLKNNIVFKNMFKISGRYLLNKNFVFDKFNNNKNIFKLAIEVINQNPRVSEYYYTSLYKISYNYFKEFCQAITLLYLNKNILSRQGSFGFEQELPLLLQKISGKNIIHTVETLGLTQNISVWRIDQYKNQLYV